MEPLHYELPEERIALFPVEPRDSARLLVAGPDGPRLDARVADLPGLLEGIRHVVVNASRVVKARLLFPRESGQKPFELFFLEPDEGEVASAMNQVGFARIRVLVGGSKKWKTGVELVHPDGIRALRVAQDGAVSTVELRWDAPLTLGELLDRAGRVPLPPYFRRADESSDAERYQTVYAQNAGSVAAPTAGLHFTPELVQALESSGRSFLKVELHVGAGTFKPIDATDAREHAMHAEEVHLPRAVVEALSDGAPTLAVGTTSSRSLESAFWLAAASLKNNTPLGNHLEQWSWEELAAWWDLQPGDDFEKRRRIWLHALDQWPPNQSEWTFTTALMMVPGYRVRTWEALLTNFHQPGSTLLMLIASVVGDAWKELYAHALRNDYRFLSYGDASLLWRY